MKFLKRIKRAFLKFDFKSALFYRVFHRLYFYVYYSYIGIILPTDMSQTIEQEQAKKQFQTWKEEKIKELATELAKEISTSVKEEVWYMYSLRFKKDRQGNVILSDPSADEISKINRLY